MPRKEINIIGQKFNRLTAIKSHHKTNNNNYYWLFRCDCGKEKVINKSLVIRGYIRSCGCLHKEKMKIIGKNNKIHGMDKYNKFYSKWTGIKSRCLNKNRKKYKDYGGRGIKVCNRWMNFLNFKEDMYESYKKHVKEFGEKNTTIDRINNNGNYCKENCKWSTLFEQANNKRNNNFLTYNNKTMTIAQWERKLNFYYGTLNNRINILKWSIERAISTPLNNKI